jgi:hypothetical protein
MDMSLSEAGMYECENGHVVDEDYVTHNIHQLAKRGVKACLDALNTSMAEALRKEHLQDQAEMPYDELHDALIEVLDDYEGRYCLPACLCPICTLQHLKSDDILSYLLQNMGRTRYEVCNRIRSEYGGKPEEFYKAIQ